MDQFKGNFEITACEERVMYITSKFKPNPTLSEKAYRTLRLYTTVHHDYPLTKFHFRSSVAIQTEKERHASDKYWFIIHPFSQFHYVQELVAVFLYLIVYTVDLYAAIAAITKDLLPALITYILMVLNIAIVINQLPIFFTGNLDKVSILTVHSFAGSFLNEHSYVELNPKKHLNKCFTEFFFCDLLPLTTYIIQYLLRNSIHLQTMRVLLVLLRTFRAYKIKAIYKTIKMLKYNKFFARRIDLYQAILFFLGLQFTVVFYTWIRLIVPELIKYVSKSKSHDTFVTFLKDNYQKQNRNLSVYMILIHLFRDSLSQLLCSSSLIYGTDLSAIENVINALLIILGLCFRGYFTIMIIWVAQPKFYSSLKYLKYKKVAKHLMGLKESGDSVWKQFSDFLDYTVKCDYINEQRIFKYLQTRMKYEIFNESSANLIRKCPLFQELPEEFIIHLALNLKFETFSAGKVIIRINDVATCMYFISSGTVAIYNNTGAEVCHLHDANYFGEIGLISQIKNVRIADVIAIEYSMLYRLDAHDFENVIKKEVEFYNRIVNTAKERTSSSRRTRQSFHIKK